MIMEAEKKKKNRSVEPTVLEWSRYLVLDKCLRDQHRYYHMEDLVTAVNKMLVRYDFTPVSERTISSDLKFMQSGEGFNAVLAKRYDGHTKIYTYEDPHFTIMKLPMTDRESDLLSATIMMLGRFRGMPNYPWLENTLRMLRVKFNVGRKTASVVLSQNEELKGLDDWFEPLFEACRKRLIVTMMYQRLDRMDKEPVERVVKPYQMRQYNNRWYLVGREDSKVTKKQIEENKPILEMVVVPIDRIRELTIETVDERDAREKDGGKFIMPSDEKIEKWFKDVVGVSRQPGAEPEPVKVKAWGLTAHFMETKPIHPSQKVIEEGEMTVEGPWYKKNPLKVRYKVFEMMVIPNEPLIQALLVYANECEVLEPKSLREKIATRAEAILKYNDKKE